MNDFPDWLSPIVVKELRQGLRSRAFASILFVLQGAMVFCLLVALAAASNPHSRGAANGFFWTIVGGVLLVAMPMRGFAAIGGEIKGNTLDLLLLTQLSAWRVAAGKWAALFLQSLLLIATLFPYVVLRYFVGGVDLTGELQTLGMMLVGSALLTAIAVGGSPVAHQALGRFLIAIFLIFGLNIIPRLLIGHSGPGTGLNPWIWPVMALLLGPLFTLLALELGLAKITPPGESIAWRKRLLVFATLAVAAGIAAAFDARGFLAIVTAVVAGPICLDALLAKAPEIPALYQPLPFFKNWPRLGRVAAWFLEPGLSSGLRFTALVTMALLLFLGTRGISALVLIGIAAVFVPVAMARAVPRVPLFPMYLGFQFAGVLLAILLFQFKLPVLAGLHPTAAYLVQLFSGTKGFEGDVVMLLIAGAVSLAALLFLCIVAYCERKSTDRLCREAEASEPVAAA